MFRLSPRGVYLLDFDEFQVAAAISTRIFLDKGCFALGLQPDCERPTLMTEDSYRSAHYPNNE